jgi:hypothetical protein
MRPLVHLRLPVLIVVILIRKCSVILISSLYLTNLEDDFDEELAAVCHLMKRLEADHEADHTLSHLAGV